MDTKNCEPLGSGPRPDSEVEHPSRTEGVFLLVFGASPASHICVTNRRTSGLVLGGPPGSIRTVEAAWPIASWTWR